jgi:hypothetical protein
MRRPRRIKLPPGQIRVSGVLCQFWLTYWNKIQHRQTGYPGTTWEVSPANELVIYDPPPRGRAIKIYYTKEHTKTVGSTR